MDTRGRIDPVMEGVRKGDDIYTGIVIFSDGERWYISDTYTRHAPFLSSSGVYLT